MAHHLGKADWTNKDRIKGLIESYSHRYDTLFWTTLIELVGTRKRNTIADFGCGPGLFLVDAFHKFTAKRLVGLDESKEMLEQAKAFIEERTSAESYELTVTNFDETKIPLLSRSIDLAFCGFMLHEVASPQNFVDQVTKTLRTNGEYIIYDYISGHEEEFVRKMAERGMPPEQAKMRYPHMCKHSLDDIVGFMETAGLMNVQGKAINDIRCVVVGLVK